MPQKSRAYYTKAGIGYKTKDAGRDTIAGPGDVRRGAVRFRPVAELQAKKRRGVNHARTTTRRMEEPCGIQLVGAGCQNLDRRILSKFHASLKITAVCYIICI